MLLEHMRVAKIGCGIAGDLTARTLVRLGVTVVSVRAEVCPTCGDLCDADEDWRRAMAPPTLEVEAPAGEPDFQSLANTLGHLDGAIVDDVDDQALAAWSRYADRLAIPTVLLCSVGHDSEAVVRADGLTAEALSGVIGTMGPTGGAPMPFGFLYGESNLAVRAAAMLVDRMLAQSRSVMDGSTASWVFEASAADACLDAMDNPWQEWSLPGPIHQAPNPLSREHNERSGPQRAGLVPYGLFEARDAWVCLVGAGTTQLMADRMGRPELVHDARFATPADRVANRGYVVDIIQNWIGGLEGAGQFLDLMGNDAVVAKAVPLNDVDDQELLGFESPTAPFVFTVQGRESQ